MTHVYIGGVSYYAPMNLVFWLRDFYFCVVGVKVVGLNPHVAEILSVTFILKNNI